MKLTKAVMLSVMLLVAGSGLASTANADPRWPDRDRHAAGPRWGGGAGWPGGAYSEEGRDESCGRTYFYHDVYNGWTNSHISAFKEHYLRCGGPSWIQKVDIGTGQVLANYAWDPRCQGWRKLCDAEVRDLAYRSPGGFGADDGPGYAGR